MLVQSLLREEAAFSCFAKHLLWYLCTTRVQIGWLGAEIHLKSEQPKRNSIGNRLGKRFEFPVIQLIWYTTEYKPLFSRNLLR